MLLGRYTLGMAPPLSLDVSRVVLKRRRTKIVATIGPSSWSPQRLDELIAAGVNVFRMNMSHGTHESHEKAYRRIRAAAKRARLHIAILADLCGPKIRVGTFKGGGIDLEDGEEVVVTTRSVTGQPGLIPSQYKALAGDVKAQDHILLDDGQLHVQVIAAEGTEIRCRVVHGGRLKDRKGINLPGVAVSAPALTPKDRRDAKFALGLGVDYLALSFVRQAKDVVTLRRLVTRAGHDTHIIAKIEKPEALQVIGEILQVADGIMIARGDLGVELPVEEVPLIQKDLVRLAIHANKPVIMATQMLESMIDNARPTRAEVTDVASAAQAGADAVMLSAETAAGDHPVAAVKTMDRVLRLIEGYQWKHGRFRGLIDRSARDDAEAGAPLTVPEALSRATSLLSRGLAVRSVVVPTNSGRTARWVSSERPAAPVVALAANESVCRRASLYWGVASVKVTKVQLRDAPKLARRAVERLGLASKGETVLLVWDSSIDRSGTQPSIAVLQA